MQLLQGIVTTALLWVILNPSLFYEPANAAERFIVESFVAQTKPGYRQKRPGDDVHAKSSRKSDVLGSFASPVVAI